MTQPIPPDPAVARAVAALRAFHVDRHTSERKIRSMLAVWAHYHELSPEQVDAVVAALKDAGR